MAVSWEKIEHNKIKLEIEVAAPEVDSALERAYRTVVKQVNLAGFRKGKVPRHILEARFGPEILHQDALEFLIPAAYDEAIAEVNAEPIDQPEFDFEEIEKGKPFLFKAIVEVLPPVELGEYKGMEVEQEITPVTEAGMERYLESLRDQHARLVPIEDEGVGINNGDLALIDFQGYIGGEAFPEGEAENYSLELGSNSFIPGFEEQLVGMKVGEEREIEVTFPDEYRKKELAGKEALFKVELKQIKQKQLPDLDDDFIREISEFENLSDFKTDLQDRMEKTNMERAKTELEEMLIEKATALSQVELPQILVERQIDRLLGEMDQFLAYQGLNLEKFVELSGKTMEEIREEKREEAERRTKANLVLDAVVKKEGFTVDDSEIDAKIAELAESYNDQPDRIRELFEKQGRIPVMREELRVRKAVDLLVREAKITRIEKAE
ncbi:MAG: trigger factor [Firmicutes bacterium]|nr:trigger factor [Bacillota bacterium]